MLKRATNKALPAAGFYYQKNNCKVVITKGYSNIQTQTEINNNSRFVIGSITKVFVGVTSVKLANAGIFSLDDTILKWLPTTITDRIPNSSGITIRNLLSQTSGIIDYTHSGFIPIPVNYQTELDALNYVFDQPLLFETGTQFKYSNTNYLLMGLIIKAATNKDFAINIRELILEPLGLDNTFHLSQPDNFLEYVHGYMEVNGVLQDTHEMVKLTPFADGFMVSNLHDLAIFIQVIFTNKNFMDDAAVKTLLSSPVQESN